MRQLKPMSCIRLCIVVLEALTPTAVHSLWISPHFWMGFVSQSSPGCGLSLLLVHFFLPHLFLPFASLLMCLDTELCEQPASFAMTFVSCLLVQGVNGRLLDNCQVSSLPHDCVAYRTRLRDNFKGLCRCFELISWLECGTRCLQYGTFSQYSNFLRYWIWGFH